MKTSKWFLKVGLAASAVLALCGFESAPVSFIISNSTYSGHEEITRQALNNTLKRFQNMGSLKFAQVPELVADLDPTPKGLFGEKSQNMVIHGNFSSDFPQYTTVLSLADFWKIPKIKEFEHPQTQVLHFLRNYKDSQTIVSAKETCFSAREKIKQITKASIEMWNSGDKTKALFLIGHATHTIQDSFSSAHAIRETTQNFDLKNICYYGVQMNKSIGKDKDICYHNAPDSADVIWTVNQGSFEKTQNEWPNEASSMCDKKSSYPETDLQKQSCLKHEARLARLATEKYLFIVFAHLNLDPEQRKKMDDFLSSLDSRLFEGPTGNAELDVKMARGIMRCDDLSDKEIFGVYVDPNGSGGG